MSFKIAITTSSFGEKDRSPLVQLEQAQIQPLFNPFKRQLKEDEIVPLLKGVQGLIAGTEPLTRAVLKQLPELRVISRCGSGLENVDLGAAKEFNIKVFNTPTAPVPAVAELVLSFIFALFRQISRMDASMHQGQWKKESGFLVAGKKAGIIGYGRIGKKVAELLKAVEMDVRFCDPYVPSDGDIQNMEFFSLLKWADVITVHIAGNQTGESLFNTKALMSMKKGAYFINTSRGELVDEEALFQCLETKHLAGAALDVYKKEPYSGNFSKMENVILTPHIASFTLESRSAMEMEAVGNLLKGLYES